MSVTPNPRLNGRTIFNSVVAIILFLGLGTLISRIKIKGDSHVKVDVELKAHLDDIFYLYYLPEAESEDSDKNSLKKELKGKDRYQVLSYYIPDSIPVKKLRFDLGNDPKQKKVRIRKITLTYNGKHLTVFNPWTKINYFNTNEFAIYRGEIAFLLNEPVNGNYDPIIYSKDFFEEYQDLLSAKKQIPFPYLISFIFVFALLVYITLYTEPLKFITLFYNFASCFFVFLLLLPLIDETFGLTDKVNAEKRELSKRPVLSGAMLEYPKLFEQYYDDNFGFRNVLVKLSGKLKFHVFNTSSVPSKCAVGKDGWLFLDGEFYEITKDLTKENLYTASELKKKIREWENRKQSLEKDNIKYYKASWPDKHYIYPEYLPFSMKVINKDTITRTDQAINYLKSTGSKVEIIDVRESLISAKKNNQVYEKYDSHWNSYGAFIAYTALMKRISIDFPKLKPKELSEFNVTWNNEMAGDMAQLLNIDVYENKPNFKLKNDSSKVEMLSTEGFPEKTIIFRNDASDTPLTALIYRDSFTSALLPFLQLHFKNIVLLWNVSFSDDMIKKVKPDLVIECYASRYFK